MDDKNDSWLSAQGYRCFEQHRVVNDKNNSRSRELKVTNDLDNLGLWII